MTLVDLGLDLNYELAEGLSLNGGAWYASWDAGGAADELDLYIGLTKTLGAVDLSVGYTYYIFRVLVMTTQKRYSLDCQPSLVVVSVLP